jgi:hypothetical protein
MMSEGQITAAGVLTVNVPDDVTGPDPAVTVMGPLVAPAGSVAVISEDETTMKVAGTPLKSTEVTPVNPVPLIVTEIPEPEQPETGLKPDIVADGVKVVKFRLRSSIPRPSSELAASKLDHLI